MALASLGLVWVLIGPGLLARKALLYGALLLVLGPVVIHDLRRDKRLAGQRLDLLNLVAHTLGAIEIDASEADKPYRHGQLRAGPSPSGHDDDDDDDDHDDDDDD
ncbi:hypothetical protein G6O69_36990 [Pseudenhygromyxa sp. WMMC2535]|uniref:hypothetical protein n=1 Tax=Pseudenhygromyxa sp. WMMC2535 TaxID=2712867 RepID=UPI001595DF9E|nr:hypothetical protein [Pseudenhygromyxa sp. WMMC2535]NVB43475.1 hypothetical protein [Pseudenhygromyxa sp. WMMC2535]